MITPDLEKPNMDIRQQLHATVRLEADLSAARNLLAALSDEEARHKEGLKLATEEIATLKRLILDQTQELKTQKKLLKDQEKELLAARARTKQTIAHYAELDRKIEVIYRSTSWRITRPLRRLASLLKRKAR